MDNLTHTLVGATLARTRLGGGRGTMAALLLASNAPDVDIVTAWRGTDGYVHWHRGPTHGPVGLVTLAFATAAIVWGAGRLMKSDGKNTWAPFGRLLIASVAAITAHVLMDLPTAYGTRLLAPFDWHWFSLDWLPIVDVYLLAILAAGLWFGSAPARRRRSLATVLILILANYGLRAAAHRFSIDAARRAFGPSLGTCEASTAARWGISRWPDTDGAARPDGTCFIDIAAMPTLLSPFRWRIITQFPNTYELHDVDLLETWSPQTGIAPAFWRQVVRYPNHWTPPVFAAATSHVGQVFLGFSRYPAARSVQDRNGGAVVRWTDMRFVQGALLTDQPVRMPNPFNVTIRLDPDGRVIQEQIGMRVDGRPARDDRRQE
jgi:membrane-bound metal-dependent hydrolase YbcI (DUF457 family)